MAASAAPSSRASLLWLRHFCPRPEKGARHLLSLWLDTSKESRRPRHVQITGQPDYTSIYGNAWKNGRFFLPWIYTFNRLDFYLSKCSWKFDTFPFCGFFYFFILVISFVFWEIWEVEWKYHFWSPSSHSVWKSQKMSHSTLRAKQATVAFWV